MSLDKLFVDKYVPSCFDEVIFNQDIAQVLTACAKSVEIPHIVLRGCDGSGRKTFANLYIKSKYLLSKLVVKNSMVEIKNGTKTIELQLLYSDYHYHIDPSTHGVYDRVIIQHFTKDILQTRPISNIPYHTVIINNAERLTNEAQQSFRRTLEKNIVNSRFIFIVNRDYSLIGPLMSRCIQIRLKSPSNTDVTNMLQKICIDEKMTYQMSCLQKIAAYSKRNLAHAMNLLQYMSLNYPEMLSGADKTNFDIVNIKDHYYTSLFNYMMTIKELHNIGEIRNILFELLVHCIDPLQILKNIFHVMFNYLGYKNDIRIHQLIEILSKYENSLKSGSKPIYHLEGACISIIMLINNRQLPDNLL